MTYPQKWGYVWGCMDKVRSLYPQIPDSTVTDIALTDVQVKNAKCGEKPRKMTDGRGLYLLVHPNGGKYWRLKYRIDGREKLSAIGACPDVGLKEARESRDAARKLLTNGIDPSAQRQAEAAARSSAESFEAIAREWFSKFSPRWAPSHAEKVIRRLEKDVFPGIGKRPIAEIKAPELLAVLRRTETRGALETAHRAIIG